MHRNHIIGAPQPQKFLTLGGTISQITRNGVAFQLHTFTANGNFTVIGPQGLIDADLQDLWIEMLLVAGGGGGGMGGGGYYGGGGGGGGARHFLKRLFAGVYPIVIGPGGAAATGGLDNSANGSDSTALGETANGGGGGGRGLNGGSGSAGKAGANGGGGGAGSAAAGAGGAASPATTPIQGIPGQVANVSGAGGYGGGIASNGTNYPVYGVDQKNGFTSDIDGTVKPYGSGNGYGTAAVGPANTGHGGSGGQATAFAGGSGIVHIAIPLF